MITLFLDFMKARTPVFLENLKQIFEKRRSLYSKFEKTMFSLFQI